LITAQKVAGLNPAVVTLIIKELHKCISFFYFKCLLLQLLQCDKIEIVSGFQGKEKINVTAMEIPFWSLNDFGQLDEKLKETIDWNLNRLCNDRDKTYGNNKKRAENGNFGPKKVKRQLPQVRLSRNIKR